MSETAITDPALMAVVLGYCTAHNLSCWVIRTPPTWATSAIGGTSARLLDIIEDTAEIQIANGDRRHVPVSELSMRG